MFKGLQKAFRALQKAFKCSLKAFETPLSECRSGSRGYLEDLGAILEVLGVMVITIWKALKKERDSSIRFQIFMEKCRDMAMSDFGFRSTFNEGSVSFRSKWNVKHGERITCSQPGVRSCGSWTLKTQFKGLQRPCKRHLKSFWKAFSKLFEGLEKA